MNKKTPAEMTKAAAAEFLGVSERWLERNALRYHIIVETREEPTTDGRTRPRNYYQRADLERVKEEMKNPTPAETNGNGSNALALRPSAQLAQLVELLSARTETPAPVGDSISDLSHKLILNLDEAARLSGLSRHFLRESIDKKGAAQLKAKKLGRGWKVSRVELQRFAARVM